MVPRQDRRNRAAEAIKNLRGRIATYEVRTMLDMLEDLYEAAKDDLVGCNPQDFIAKQARTKTFKELIDKIQLADKIPQE